MSQKRQPRGLPVGGQFAQHEREGAEVVLCSEDDGFDRGDSEGGVKVRERVIRSEQYARLMDRLKENEKIAKKLGVDPPRVEVLSEFVGQYEHPRLGVSTDETFYKVRLEEPKLAWDGWRFLAVVDHESGVVRSAPGSPEGLAMEYSGVDRSCDHCGTNRERKETIIVEHEDGERKRIGGSCVKKFLGGFPTLSSALFDYLDDELYDEEDLFGSGEKYATIEATDTEYFLISAATIIRLQGYTPSDFDYPTKMRAKDLLYPPRGATTPEYIRGVQSTPEDVIVAQKAREWAISLPQTSDFNVNLAAAAKSPLVRKNSGLLAYIPEGYRRYIEKEERGAARAKAAAQQPQPGAPVPIGRTEVEGEILSIQEKFHNYGSTMKIRIKDSRGFQVFGTAPSSVVHEMEVGDRISLTGSLVPSDGDKYFGFFSRPTKATLTKPDTTETDTET